MGVFEEMIQVMLRTSRANISYENPLPSTIQYSILVLIVSCLSLGCGGCSIGCYQAPSGIFETATRALQSVVSSIVT